MVATPHTAIVAAFVLLVQIVVVTSFKAPPAVTIPATQRGKDGVIGFEWPWDTMLDLTLGTHGWENTFGPTFEAHNISLFNHVSPQWFTALATNFSQHFPTHAEELQGLSAAFGRAGHPVSFEYLVGWVYYHELAHSDLQQEEFQPRACTAALVRCADGSVIHGRNMDQSPASIRNITLTMHLSLPQGDELVAVDWYWVTSGFMTATMRGVASAQENWRFSKPPLSSSEMLPQLTGGITPQVFLFRHAFTEERASQATIKQHLVNAKLAAPMYAALSGMGGTIITKAVATESDPELVELSADPSKQPWFVVQTNYDHWLPDPSTDARRTAATLNIQNNGQILVQTPTGMFAVMATPPVLNDETAYTVIMHASASTKQNVTLAFVHSS